MRILVGKHELHDGATDADAAAIVAALRKGGVDAYSSDRRDLNANAEKSFSWLLAAAETAERARRALAGEEEGGDLDLVNEIIVGKVKGYEPLRYLVGVWQSLDLETRTAAIAGYYDKCQNAKRRSDYQERLASQTAGCSPRLAALVKLVLDALPLDDQLKLEARRIAFVEGDGRWRALRVNGVANNERVEIEVDGRSDKQLLRTIAHEALHVVRDHTALLALVETDEEFKALTAVFDRQAYALAEKLAFDALPDNLGLV